MKFRVEREVLGEAVSWVARALPTRPVVPVLSGLLVRADTSGLTLSCFDYEVSARVVVAADVGEPGAALVPGRLLADITRSLPQDQVEVTSVADMVMLTCGSAEFALVSLALAEYPKLPELPDVIGVADGGALAVAAAQVVPSASRDDTLPMLTAVCLDIDGHAMTLAATDRYRLAVRTIGWDSADAGLRASALVPARTLADMAKTMAAGVPVTIAFGQPGGEPSAGSQPPIGQVRPADGMISFEGGGRRLTARLVGGEFIRYESRFPAEFGSSAELPAGPFTEAVRRVALVADRTSPVELTFRPDSVVVEARSDGRARAVESVPARFAGEQNVISFNPHWLLDGLTAAALSGHQDGPDAAAAGAGSIRLEFTSPAKPALITWAGDGKPDGDDGAADRQGARSFRYLLVPLRAPGSG
ncbi:MAG TPA: DNA polymerase III subunit beta [Streptosporangiaceae bacterium]|nr:DNA polymerase III subunit beta [Streptosporangiaceae bacterium]